MKNTSKSLENLIHQGRETHRLFKPDFYDLSNEKNRKSFYELLQKPGIVVSDTISGQLRELIKFRHPSAIFSAVELDEKVKSHLGNADLIEYGVWVYYPWSNKLVHLLSRDEFIDVRTSRNQYKITPAERDILATKKIGVIGLSVGQSVSVTLAMERICGEIRLADFDLLELTNLNRIRTGVHNLGLPKVYSVAREIAEIDPYLEVKCFPEGLTEGNMDDFFTGNGKLDLVVEESDGFDIKIQCRYKARELGVPVIMEASDRCMVDVERFDLEPERPILHGIVKHLDVKALKALRTNEEKIPYMLDVLGFESTTARLRASMLEMQHTINTWPQLASAVTMGGGITADVSRRMLLNYFTESGRYYVDIEQIIGNKIQPQRIELRQSTPLPGDVISNIASRVSGHDQQSPVADKDIERIVVAACSAPSFANCQPWLWLQSGGDLLLINTLSDNEFLTDPGDLNIQLSFGAAIENARLKAEALGYEVKPLFYPYKEDSRVVAKLNLSASPGITPPVLADFIDKRKTNRASGSCSALSDKILNSLKLAVEDDSGVSALFLNSRDEISRFASLAGECERIRLTDPQMNAEYFHRIVRADGVDSHTGTAWDMMSLPPSINLSMQVIKDPAVCALLHNWDLGTAFARYYTDLVNSSGAIGMLSATSMKPKDLVKTGMAMQRIWLRATEMQLAFQPISLPLALSRAINSSTPEKKSNYATVVEQLSLIFSGVEAKNVVFIFRVFEAAQPQGCSPRKPLNETLIKVN